MRNFWLNYSKVNNRSTQKTRVTINLGNLPSLCTVIKPPNWLRFWIMDMDNWNSTCRFPFFFLSFPPMRLKYGFTKMRQIQHRGAIAPTPLVFINRYGQNVPTAVTLLTRQWSISFFITFQLSDGNFFQRHGIFSNVSMHVHAGV